jgi:arylsulfatase A
MQSTIKPLVFLFAGLIANVNGRAAEDAAVTTAKPNIILIYADDLGYGDVGCYGATKVSTPHIDRLAREGRKFTDAHSPSAVCTPSRYGLLTGQYGWRKDIWGPHGPQKPLRISTKTMTLPKLLREQGYATACVGKWHLGFGATTTDWNKELKPGPLEVGFDYYFGVPLVNSGPPYVYVEDHHVVGLDPKDPFILRKKKNDPRPPSPVQHFPAKAAMDRWAGAKRAHELFRDKMVGTTLTEKTVQWMRKQKKEQPDKPFFMYLATTNIHHPFTPHPRFEGTSQCGRYGDFIHELDWIVGEVLKTLEELKIADNTLVVFTSDNGGMLNHGGQDAWKAGHRLNGDLLGFKFGVWEGGHRIPFIARWPGKIPAGSVSHQLIGNVDMMATMAKIAGRPLKGNEGPDSFDVLAALRDNPKEPVRDHLILAPARKTHLAIRKGNWVYIPGQGSGGFRGQNIGDHTLGGPAAHKLTRQVNSDIEKGRLKKGAPPAQLYDLNLDRSQSKNVISDHPEVAKKLKGQLKKLQKQGRSASRAHR